MNCNLQIFWGYFRSFKCTQKPEKTLYYACQKACSAYKRTYWYLPGYCTSIATLWCILSVPVYGIQSTSMKASCVLDVKSKYIHVQTSIPRVMFYNSFKTTHTFWQPPILNRTSRIPCSENVKFTLKIEHLHSKIEILYSEDVIFTVKNCNGVLNRLPGFLSSRNGNSVLKMEILFEILC